MKSFLPIDTSPETIFYTMSVYFLAAKVTKTRYTLAGALLTTLVGTVASVVIASMLILVSFVPPGIINVKKEPSTLSKLVIIHRNMLYSR